MSAQEHSKKRKKRRRRPSDAPDCVVCGRAAIEADEPDGKPRCGYHTKDPKRVWGRRRPQAEKSHEAKLVRRAQACGLLEVHTGGGPPVTAMMQRLRELAEQVGSTPEALVDQRSQDTDEQKEPLLHEGERLSSSSARLKILERVMVATWRGQVSPAQASAIDRMVRAAQREGPGGDAPPVSINFRTVTSREDAEAVKAGEWGPTDARTVN